MWLTSEFEMVAIDLFLGDLSYQFGSLFKVSSSSSWWLSSGEFSSFIVAISCLDVSLDREFLGVPTAVSRVLSRFSNMPTNSIIN